MASSPSKPVPARTAPLTIGKRRRHPSRSVPTTIISKVPIVQQKRVRIVVSNGAFLMTPRRERPAGRCEAPQVCPAANPTIPRPARWLQRALQGDRLRRPAGRPVATRRRAPGSPIIEDATITEVTSISQLPLFAEGGAPAFPASQFHVAVLDRRDVVDRQFRPICNARSRMMRLQLKKEIKMFSANLELFIPPEAVFDKERSAENAPIGSEIAAHQPFAFKHDVGRRNTCERNEN